MVRSQKLPPPPKCCVYCGAPATSRDHVIPCSLFTPPLPQMITVPACDGCQKEKSYGDDDLAHYVAMDWAGSQHLKAIDQLERAARATLKGRSKLGQAFSRGGRPRALITDAGIYLGAVLEHPIPDENRDMFKTLEYIIRGLHVVRNFRHDRRKSPLPNDCPVEVLGVDRLKANSVIGEFLRFPREGPFSMRNDVAMWMRFPHPEDQNAAYWILTFNDQVCFLGRTGRFVPAAPPN